ncbi:hypothetical protein LCGC14_0223460 [marine sediment metagenome]|uniref:Uncharacterized protein n=1 Tax=marine sediment metagenome TaxID=412755 RepID=A0A0F9XFX5_9ZZZZ|nr:hypothetical protein [bacterium]
MAKDEIADDVRKIDCKIENDGSYSCDITSGAYVGWFARCIGDFLRGRMIGGTRGQPNIIKNMFTHASRSCRGKQREYEPQLLMSGEYSGAEFRPKTEKYFIKDLIIGKGIKQTNIKKDRIILKGKGLMCLFDDDLDSLTCDRPTPERHTPEEWRRLHEIQSPYT